MKPNTKTELLAQLKNKNKSSIKSFYLKYTITPDGLHSLNVTSISLKKMEFWPWIWQFICILGIPYKYKCTFTD